jgi:hypothetical protein
VDHRFFGQHIQLQADRVDLGAAEHVENRSRGTGQSLSVGRDVKHGGRRASRSSSQAGKISPTRQLNHLVESPPRLPLVPRAAV